MAAVFDEAVPITTIMTHCLFKDLAIQLERVEYIVMKWVNVGSAAHLELLYSLLPPPFTVLLSG